MTKRRIAVAGFQHETNTFAPFKASIDDFKMADSWPGMLLGDAVIVGTKGMNLPISGAVEAAVSTGDIELVPLLWCSAEPSGPVTDEAFDWIMAELLSRMADTDPIDGLFLDLHGAMVTESHLCGESEILGRFRSLLGPDIPIAVSLDLHANISAKMVRLADVITIFRTYPHLDMAETGGRAMHELLRCLSGPPRFCAFRQAPFLIPLNAQYTGIDPCKSLYERVVSCHRETGDSVDLALGFTAADVPDCGPSVVAFAASQDRANKLADAIFADLCKAQGDFDTRLFSAEEAIGIAQATIGTVIFADVQDNPGAGASSDTTGVLKALMTAKTSSAVLGVMHDPQVAATATTSGVGAIFSAALGGKSSAKGDSPVTSTFRVLALSDGHIAYTGDMYGGCIAELGPSCLLQVEEPGCDIQVVVSSVRAQCLDLALFTHFGVNPAHAKIVCVKSTVHFRADFEPIGNAVINVASPGLFVCDLDQVDYQHYRNASAVTDKS